LASKFVIPLMAFMKLARVGLAPAALKPATKALMRVTVSLGAANRDETRWENPDDFDIFRQRKAHIAFGHGPHTCIGMHLARMETQVAITAVLDRLPNLRLDLEADPRPVILGQGFRSPDRLPVLFG
jgi:cytochrome P450